VVQALERAATKRTTLVIAHRLASIRFAHRIVVLDRERIVEEGTHRELLERKGKYAHLLSLQLGTLLTSEVTAPSGLPC
jgi:ABC-type multidrug transport system fused ATPase/permease subunit